MANYTVREFAEITGKKPSSIETYATRGKIIKTAQKKINTKNPINELFLAKYQVLESPTELSQKQPKKQKTVKPKKQKPPPKKITSQKKPPPQKKPANGTVVKNNKFIDIDYEKKQLEIEKIKKDLLLKEEELKKKRKEVIDLDQTVSLVDNYSNNLKKELSQNIQTLIQYICSRHNISSSKSGGYKLKVNDIINLSSRSSVEKLLKKLDNV